MSWRPGGGSGSFRRSGLGGSARSSDDESGGGAKPSSTSSSFLRMRPSSGSGENTSSARLGSLLSSNLNIPSASSSRSSSFRTSRDNKVDRSNSWRRSNFSSPVSQYFSDKSKHSDSGGQSGGQNSGGHSSGGQSGGEGESKSSTLPWSYSSRSYQPLNFSNPFSHNREREDVRSARTPAQSPPIQPPEEDHGGPRAPSSASSVSWTPPSSTTSTLPARRKVQKVQLLHLTEPYRYSAVQFCLAM